MLTGFLLLELKQAGICLLRVVHVPRLPVREDQDQDQCKTGATREQRRCATFAKSCTSAARPHCMSDVTIASHQLVTHNPLVSVVQLLYFTQIHSHLLDVWVAVLAVTVGAVQVKVQAAQSAQKQQLLLVGVAEVVNEDGQLLKGLCMCCSCWSRSYSAALWRVSSSASTAALKVRTSWQPRCIKAASGVRTCALSSGDPAPGTPRQESDDTRRCCSLPSSPSQTAEGEPKPSAGPGWQSGAL